MKTLLTSREFWATLLALIVIIVGQVVPGFKINIEQAVALALIVTAYLYGLSQDPGPGGWRGWILSRKFWTAALGFVLVILDGFGLVLPQGFTVEMLVTVAVILGGAIVSFAKQVETAPAPVKSVYREVPRR